MSMLKKLQQAQKMIYNLDDVISINIDLKKNEVYYEGFRFIKI